MEPKDKKFLQISHRKFINSKDNIPQNTEISTFKITKSEEK